MDESKMLSGYQLVAKGATKRETTLPELGLKDLSPNGSWLEQKQVQAAIEARKQLIEVERIDKIGILSHADWKNDLMLAEVTQKVGGYWHHMGHNVGRTLYLYPEEALYLIEINCLDLKYNDVTVSLQQAYALLLNSTISLHQYKVYASLSRLGYKVFRHKIPVKKTDSKEVNEDTMTDISEHDKESQNGNKISNENVEMEVDCGNATEESNANNINTMSESVTSGERRDEELTKSETKNVETINEEITDKKVKAKQSFIKHYSKLDKLKNRQLKAIYPIDNRKHLDELPDLFQKKTATVTVPETQFVPNNIYINKNTYVIDLERVKNKIEKSNSSTYNINDEVNGTHIRRIGRSSDNNRIEFPNRQNTFQNRPYYNVWSQHNLNYFQFNMLFQRPFLINYNILPRLQFFPRSYIKVNSPNTDPTSSNPRKRSKDDAKKFHLESIKTLANRLKNIINSGNTQAQNITALQRLITTFNTRYKSRISLTDDLDLIDEDIIETIELDDEAESKSKRSRLNEDSDVFNDNLKSIKTLASKLKDLEAKNKTSSRHKRAFTNMVRTFNKSFNADIYVNNAYEVFDRKHIDLESSDSDCVIEEPKRPSKKLKNPFSIIKKRMEKLKSTIDVDDNITIDTENYSQVILDNFQNWLPNYQEFGRAEIPLQKYMKNRLLDVKKEEFMYEYMKNNSDLYDNWMDLKLSFFSNLQENEVVNDYELPINTGNVKSLVNGDCTDMPSLLKKLSVIKNNKEVADTPLSIDFDVYTRDIANFKKTDPPKPHFRLVCLNELEAFPSGSDVIGLHSKYSGDVIIIFAIVGIKSISYLQINPLDLPVYIPNSEQ